MEVVLAALADYANVSREGKLNIMGIFDRVNAAAWPFVLPQMQVVAVFRYAPPERGTTKHLELLLSDADGNDVLRIGAELVIPPDAPLGGQVQQILGLQNIAFAHEGDYAFYIMLNDEPKARLSFNVLGPAES